MLIIPWPEHALVKETETGKSPTFQEFIKMSCTVLQFLDNYVYVVLWKVTLRRCYDQVMTWSHISTDQRWDPLCMDDQKI